MARHFSPYSEFSGPDKNKECRRIFGRDYHQIVHWPAYKIREEFRKKGYKWSKYVKISTIRNPWSRIVSLFFYGKRRHKSTDSNSQIRQNFTKFVKQEVPKWQHGIRNRWNSYEMFHDREGKRIVDYIVRLEHLKEDLEPIMQKHFPEMAPLDYDRRTNSTEHKHYSYYYTPETRDIVARIFKWEIRKFGYRFEKQKSKTTKKKDNSEVRVETPTDAVDTPDTVDTQDTVDTADTVDTQDTVDTAEAGPETGAETKTEGPDAVTQVNDEPLESEAPENHDEEIVVEDNSDSDEFVASHLVATIQPDLVKENGDNTAPALNLGAD